MQTRDQGAVYSIVGWPVGSRLRFRLDADIQPKYQHLRGTPVIVLSDVFWSSPSDGFPTWSWRQRVLALAYSVSKSGSAQPSHLEPIPNVPMLPDDADASVIPERRHEPVVH